MGRVGEVWRCYGCHGKCRLHRRSNHLPSSSKRVAMPPVLSQRMTALARGQNGREATDLTLGSEVDSSY